MANRDLDFVSQAHHLKPSFSRIHFDARYKNSVRATRPTNAFDARLNLFYSLTPGHSNHKFVKHSSRFSRCAGCVTRKNVQKRGIGDVFIVTPCIN